MSGINFLTETMHALALSGKTPEDVVGIGIDGKSSTSWESFERDANFHYDNGYGGAEINEKLVILFKDSSWLSRGEYDGSEWWEYNQTHSFKIHDTNSCVPLRECF